MSAIYTPLRIIYKIYFLLYFIVSFLLFYPFFKFYLSTKSRFTGAFKLMRFYAQLWHFFVMVPVRIKGDRHPVKKGPYLILCNHSSFLDIPCIYVVFRQYFLIAGKKEIEKWPLFNIFYTSGMNILVDRQNKSGAAMSLKRIIHEIDSGNPVALFPEGTISEKAPALIDFKQGPFALAISKQIPIIPVTFVSNWRRLQRKKFWQGLAGPGFSDVVIHEPVYTGNLKKEDSGLLARKVYQIINSPLQERWGHILD